MVSTGRTQSVNAVVTPAVDTSATGSIAGNTSIILALTSQASATIQLVPTGFSGTLNFEGSNDGGTTYYPLAVWPKGSISAGALINNVVNPAANAIYETNVAALSHARVRGSGVTAGSVAVTLRAGVATSAVAHTSPLPTGSNVIGSASLADPITPGNKATISQFHNADNQSPGGTAYGLLTGGVAQLLNGAGNIDRQRETGADGVAALGIVTGTAQLASQFSTNIGVTAVTAPFTSAKTLTPAAMSGTTRGVAWSIQVGSALGVDTGANYELVTVTAVTATTFSGLFTKAHAANATIIGFVYNQARDSTLADGASPGGMPAGTAYFWNQALNAGVGGLEIERSALGELDGATGAGTAVAAEYEFNGGGPPNAAGVENGLAFDRARSLQGKGRTTSTITTTVAGNLSVVFPTAAATGSITPGEAFILVGAGAGPETVYATAAWIPGSAATVPLQAAVVNTGQTSAYWDTYAASGPGLLGFTAIGVGIEEEALYDPVSAAQNQPAFYIERAATQDNAASPNVILESEALFNAFGNNGFERARSVLGKNLFSATLPGTVGAAGATTLTFTADPSTAAVGALKAGMQVMLWTAGTPPTNVELVIVAPSYVSGTVVPISTTLVAHPGAGTTVAQWEGFAAQGPALTGFLGTGMDIDEDCVYDPITGLYYLERAATADAVVGQNLVMENMGLLNLAGTFDRQRGAQGSAYVTDGGSTATAIAAGVVGNTVIKAAAGRLCRILATTVGTAASVLIYDNATTNTGTVIGALPANTPIGTYVFQTPAVNGITVAGAAANPAMTVAYL